MSGRLAESKVRWDIVICASFAANGLYRLEIVVGKLNSEPFNVVGRSKGMPDASPVQATILEDLR
jgi:hypothetical protein